MSELVSYLVSCVVRTADEARSGAFVIVRLYCARAVWRCCVGIVVGCIG